MGSFLGKAINPVGAIFGLPDPVRDAIFPDNKPAREAVKPRQSIASRAAAQSLSNEERLLS